MQIVCQHWKPTHVPAQIATGPTYFCSAVVLHTQFPVASRAIVIVLPFTELGPLLIVHIALVTPAAAAVVVSAQVAVGFFTHWAEAKVSAAVNDCSKETSFSILFLPTKANLTVPWRSPFNRPAMPIFLLWWISLIKPSLKPSPKPKGLWLLLSRF